MLTNKILPRCAVAAAAWLSASPALAGDVFATPMSGVNVAQVSTGQSATASSLACAGRGAKPLHASLWLGDLNGDDKADLLLTRTDGTLRATGRTWQYYPMDGTSLLSGDGTIPAHKLDLDWIVMGLGDFDGDGKSDILTRHAVSGVWHIARMNGKTIQTIGTGEATTLTTIHKWHLAAVADFDGDTQDDLLLRHTDTGRWLLYEMNGLVASTTGSGIADALPDDLDLEVAGAGDLDGDGNADLVLRHKTSGQWRYYPMAGHTVLPGAGAIGLALSSDWTLAALPDLDGNGKAELLVRHTNGTWHWYPMNGKTVLSGDAATDLSTSTDWKLAGWGDLTGDGKDDVVLRDVSTDAANKGRWMVRAMNGASAIAAQSGIATSITKVEAWDVASRDRAEGGCPAYVWSCRQSDNLPRAPTIGYMTTDYALIDVSSSATAYEELFTVNPHVSVPVSWAKYAGINGDRVRYLLNGEVALETRISIGPFTGPQSGSATLEISQGGKYDLEVALCKKNCCAKSGKKSIVVADTDGSHLGPLTWVPKEDTSKSRPNNNRATAYPNPEGHMVGAYYVEWSGYGRDYDVHNIPAHNLTHLYYGFAPICSATENDSLKTIAGSHAALVRSCKGRDDYKVSIHDPWAALQESRPGYSFSTAYKGNFGQLMELKRAHPDLVILPSVGGWTLSDPFYSFGNATYRKRFVDSMEDYLRTWKFFDGVDIDWEFPGGLGANPLLGDPPTDRRTYHDLMRELREMLDRMEIRTGRKYHLTSAISAGSEKIARVDYNAVEQFMDHILLMTYDFYGGWDTNVLGHHTGLFAGAFRPDNDYNAHDGVQALLSQGVSPEKVAIGVAMYGRGWSGVTPPAGSTVLLAGTATGKHPRAKAYTNGIWEPGVQDYWSIAVDERAARKAGSTSAWSYEWDTDAFAPYLYRSTDKALISYDNPRSVKAKGGYLRSKGLAGLFSWEIDADDGSLLNAMHEGLGHGTAVANRAPFARARQTGPFKAGGNGRLDGSGSFDLDGDRVSLTWSQTSGTTVTLSSTSAERPTFAAPDVTTNETLGFTLTASDGTLTATDTVTVSIVSATNNNAPVADAGPDQTDAYTIGPATTVSLDGSGSSDPDGDTLTYAWTQTSGTTQTLARADRVNPSFSTAAVTADETLIFQLEVSDGLASDTDTVSITLKPAPPNRAPVVTLDATKTVVEGTQVSILATATDPDGDAIGWSWDTGGLAGVTGTTTGRIGFTAPQVTADTTYTLKATATDDGTPVLSTSASIVLTVTNQVAGSCKRTDPNAGSYPAWDPKKTYVKGNRVAHDGLVWEAKYWTGTEPKVTATTWPADWTLTSKGVEIDWNPQRAYNTGDEANHGARRYRAAWYTKGDSPADGSPWSDVGANTCTANQTPVANAGPDQSVTSGTAVTLDGSGSSDADTGDTLTYAWSHTSGTPAVTLTDGTTASPTFTAPTVTTSTAFVFTLTVSDGTATATDTVTVTVSPAGMNRAPVADAGSDQSVATGATVTLDGTGSSDPDTGDTLTYRWTQTGGSPTVSLTGAATASPTFTVPSSLPGSTTLTFTLTVSDGTLSDTDTVDVSIGSPNRAPVANAGPDQSVTAGATVVLSGSGTDPDGDNVTLTWAQAGDSAPRVTLSGTGTKGGVSFTAPAVTATTVLTFGLTATDGSLEGRDTMSVTVAPMTTNTPPTANAGADQSVTSGTSVTLDGSGSADPDTGDTLTWSWAHTSGTPAVTLTGATTASPTFTAPAVTTSTGLVFTLTVSDGTASATDTVTVTVTPNRAPTAAAGADQSVTSGASVTLDGSGSSDPDTGDTLTYAWAHTSGTPAVTLTGATSATATFTAPTVTASTSLVFTLTVSDGTASDTDTVTVTVAPATTGTCSRTDPNAGSYTAWSSAESHYSGGDQVSHEGLVWEAKYWTREEPVITATDWPSNWTLLSTTELKWHPERVYVKNDEADHGTRRYRAAWWTQGDTPTAGGPWGDIGTATCP